jgi:methionyl-tRNA synthetase
MSEKILVCVAWPYANGSLHLGQIAGAYLPADIFARYHRLIGNDVLMVSGSDQHGTPITVRAEQEGRSPKEVVEQFHADFLESWPRLGVSFDIFTTTGTENHIRTAHEIFLRLVEDDYIYKGSMSMLYCSTDRRFLPDRYVEGKCPYCGYDGARGDQCDNCGRPLNAVELVEPRCRLDGSTPELRESEHFFLRLSALNDRLRSWASHQDHWRKNVYNFTQGLLTEGLHDRAITRDIDWGVPVPLPCFESKRIYVWFEAVIGYLSATKEWGQRNGNPELWREFWERADAKSYYFIGKDNIAFHTIIWPAILMAYGGLNLPTDVPANQYLTMSGAKASTSRNWAIWLNDFLSRYDPDPLRYYLSANMPETSDSDFTWADFVRRNNDELLATWGNLVHRVLTFTNRHFASQVPAPTRPLPADDQLLALAEETLGVVGEHLAFCRFRAGIDAAMGLAREANRYLEENAPWRNIEADRERAGTTLYAALSVINALKVAFYPYLPFTSEQVHAYLGYESPLIDNGWRMTKLEPGQTLREPKPLFKKLEAEVVEEEERRLGV